METTTRFPTASQANGIDIGTSGQWLRNYQYVERRMMRVLAGWFLRAPAYETKYRLAYHLYDHAEHVAWLRARLAEMRGGQPDASVAPALRTLMDEALHAPDTDSMLRSVYGAILPALLQAYREHLIAADSAANANEIRMLRRLIPEIASQIEWYRKLNIADDNDPWQQHIKSLIIAAGGIRGDAPAAIVKTPHTHSERFERPHTIFFDQRIRIGDLTPYESRKAMDVREGTIEQFKVFFNELYAAALLASILYDAFDDGYPWEFYSDFAHHFWDEVRHSEFGALRLKELGQQPSVCNPALFEASESMPVLHRICYLTLGLEVFFMPRKQPRVKEYMNNDDHRSQLFADQDWSDETNHVHYGKRWVEFLLKDDHRDAEDIQEEVRKHLERVTGRKHETISAPY